MAQETHCTERETGSGWTFACITFGCKVNQYETQAIREAWLQAGGTETDTVSEAQLVLVNSCAITSRAERDARNALIRLRREAPAALLVLTGCAARLVASFVPRKHAPHPEADCILVQERKEELCRAEVIADLVRRLHKVAQERRAGRAAAEVGAMHWKDYRTRPWPAMQIEHFKRVRPVLKVQDGCTHRCTYCIVPLTRGPHVSRHPDDVIAEAERLLQDHAEIMLSGVNLGQYGRDEQSFGDFWTLVQKLEEALAPDFAGRRRLRISSLEPSQLDARGCEILGASTLIAPHLHISLQHASSSVLKRMGRGHYSASTLTRALERLHAFWPVMGLGADILVGFPGERPEDVDALCRFVEETPFTYAHVFPYSRRPGTAAASFPDQLDKKEKAARAAEVRAVVAEKARAFWQAQSMCQHMELALDAAEGHLVEGCVHAVDAFYTPCFIETQALHTLSAGAGRKDFVQARACGVCEKGVLVSIEADPASRAASDA